MLQSGVAKRINIFRRRQDQHKCRTLVEQKFEHVQISFNIFQQRSTWAAKRVQHVAMQHVE